MAVTLRPEHEKLIAQAIDTGAYENADQVIERALGLLYTEDEWLSSQKDLIEEKIERAFGQFERNEFYSAEDSRADLEARKAEWRRENSHG